MSEARMSNTGLIATMVLFVASWGMGYFHVGGWQGWVIGLAYGVVTYRVTETFIIRSADV